MARCIPNFGGRVNWFLKLFCRLSLSLLRAGLNAENLFHLVDQIAQVKRLGKHLGVLGGCRIGVERDGGEAGDEDHLEIGVELGRPAGKFDAVHLGHDDVGQKQRKRFLSQPVIGACAIIESGDLITGLFQRFHQETAHVVVIFRQKNFQYHRLNHIGALGFRVYRSDRPYVVNKQ